MKSSNRVIATVSIFLGGFAATAASEVIRLELPVKCSFGTDCFVQQYFDHDPSSGAKDYRCGTMVYDGHDGVDLRVPTVARQKRGVEVVAAAPGTVRGTRDGMDDVSVAIAGLESVKDRECGNGVVVQHEGGWETQYCHMAKGSVQVKSGQRVSAGAVLGLVGQSGKAEFPHLHFSVRHNEVKLDPFAWDVAAGTCGSGSSLWSDAAQIALAYQSPVVINSGFATGPITMDDIELGRADEGPLPNPSSPAVVSYVRAIGLAKGDEQILTLIAPDGSVLANRVQPGLDRDKAQWMSFVGKKLTTERWLPGRYKSVYEVRRNEVVVLTKEFSLLMQ